MAYTQLLRVLHRKLHTASLLSVHTCKLTQSPNRAVTTRLVFRETLPSPALRLRGFSLDCTARNQKISPEEGDKSVSRYQAGTPKLSTAQKVKEAGRDFTYLIVVLVGFGVTGALLYVVFQELFSSTSPNKVYGKAFDKVKSHPEVIGAFGEPLKCYGETTRRGRRQQVSHLEYLKDGLKHMRLKFYIEGSEPGLKGIVHSESKENPETGKYEFRYIVVEMDTYPRRTIVVEDNRSKISTDISVL
ncbi:mitochondrial import inner membrane translocase subunit Tim21 [Salarias fasciatus]|uniref:Mitochondrial import inner membrane translocase subunit Tim21 n=1 Tax=Salarias fasciatus TaxID=181472 RepID=A0A672JFU9_SALFA|nr:mitochondrial import inner membrane translocase subunit Tim21 [Salarias fasciatus]